MQEKKTRKHVLIDGSRLIIESLARAGAEAFVGYPITPANLLYQYGSQRMRVMLAAPDEITTVQWMSGLSMTGKLPVTATSFPGFALMIESINMAYMMEIPMVIVLVQRLGPATGTATCGAQGDLLLLKGMVSGGHPVPVLATSDFNDCWALPARAAHIAVTLRTPVVLITSKEEVMTQKSFSLQTLPDIEPVKWPVYTSDKPYKPYEPVNMVPAFLSLGQTTHQVRFNASTHDQNGILQHASTGALENTRRLEQKILSGMVTNTIYDYDEQADAKTLIIAYGITALSARQSIRILRSKGMKVSLLIPKTLLPTPQIYATICRQYNRIVIAEENINNQFGELLWGIDKPESVHFTGSLGTMITPDQIMEGAII